MFANKLSAEVRDSFIGFRYVFQGAKQLFMSKDVWPILILPILVNAILFFGFLFGALYGIRTFFVSHLPEVWWSVVLTILVMLLTIAAVLFIGMAVLVFIGSIVSAPFYDVLAEKLARKQGGIVPDHPWWKGMGTAIGHSAKRLWLFVLVQAALLLLHLIPGVGQVLYIGLGFISTAFFLAFEFLDYSFSFRGWVFSKRRKWCMQHRGLVLGFGMAVFIGLAIPVVNILVPPAAIAGSILLFNDRS